MANQPSHTAHFGMIKDGDTIIDEVVVTIFKSPASYTGENIVEISCHGSSYIQQRLLALLISRGCRLAHPGEFTQRAFLNGKMSLDQAEAVADLIASRSEASHRVAIQQARGGFANDLARLRERLLWFISLVELELDFSEENVEFADKSELKKLVDEIEIALVKLEASYFLGNAIKNGVPVVIAGHTNAGKSTLLNALLNEERAIVSEIHGTTRDAIEDVINLGGVMFRFIDTAGIRATHDKIEGLGINLTYNKIRQAAIILLVVDATDPDGKIAAALADVKSRINPQNQKLIVVANKADLRDDEVIKKRIFQLIGNLDLILISAKQKTNISNITSALLKAVNLEAIDNGEIIITNARHHEAISNTLGAIRRVKQGLDTMLPTDLLAQDIKEAVQHLGSISGQFSTDEVLANIFKNFCIGK